MAKAGPWCSPRLAKIYPADEGKRRTVYDALISLSLLAVISIPLFLPPLQAREGMLPGPGAAAWKLVLVRESGEAAVLVEEISTRVLGGPRLLLRSSLPAFHRSPCRASGLEPKRRWDIPPLGDAVHELGQEEETETDEERAL
jgi:hypothetical protein